MTKLISDEMRDKQAKLHQDNKDYGTSAKDFANFVLNLARQLETKDVLDYGCGKSTLQQNLPFLIKQYDPAIKVHSQLPEPVELVICIDVLEHIEPDCLDNVLSHLQELTKKNAVLVADGKPALKSFEDGSNVHLIVEDGRWWFNKIADYFTIKTYNVVDGRKSHDPNLESECYMFLCEPLKGE